MTLHEETLLHDPAISYWVKDAIASLDKRDPLASYNDVRLLLKIYEQKLKDMSNGAINI